MTTDKQSLAERLEKYATLFPGMTADLRAAAEAVRASQWRPISEAPKNKGKWMVGRYYSGGWHQKETSYLDIAIEDDYTHYFIVPEPPEDAR